MWNVIEEHNDGNMADFGPFASYAEAVEFVVETDVPCTEDVVKSVTICKEVLS